ncbi:MAG: hypothetical protein JW703_00205 [Candidatus Diapherotrites archaeon]|nr:hypothetical protein [Candidatus Diapherotrites archaeon]
MSELLKSEFIKLDLFPTQKNNYSIMVREIARFQQALDPQFELQLFELRSKMLLKKITPKKFWEEYKKLLLKSIAKNELKIKKILSNADKEMSISFNQAEKEPTEEPPKIDLRLPE